VTPRKGIVVTRFLLPMLACRQIPRPLPRRFSIVTGAIAALRRGQLFFSGLRAARVCQSATEPLPKIQRNQNAELQGGLGRITEN